MYEPAHFRIEDRESLFGVIRANPLAMLVTAGEGGLMANPIPFVLAGKPGQEKLRAHLARPNPQWREIAHGAEPLVIFQSVDHYVSPGWYATKRETHKVVPTWNYVVVQVRGRRASMTVLPISMTRLINSPVSMKRIGPSRGLWRMPRSPSSRRRCAGLSEWKLTSARSQASSS